MRLMSGLALCLLCAVAFAQATITVDATTGLVLGKQTEVSANLFGFTAFEGFPSVIADRDYRARVAAIRPGCVRFSSGSSWFVPPTVDFGWFDTPEAARQFEQTLLFGNRYPLGRFLPVMRELGAVPMASLGGAPKLLAYKDSGRPADFDQWAAYCTALIGLWRKFEPNLKLVQIWNEPNADWFRDDRTGKPGPSATDLHLQMANKVATALKQRFPDLQVGGPVLCWPPAWPPDQKGQKPWYTWEQWTVPWLKATKGTIDFFDFHVYGVSPEDFAVQTEMVYNEAWLQQGRLLPIWVTESNYDLAEEELNDPRAIFSKRVLPYERFLLRGVLTQTDKLAGNLVHDLHARRHTLLPRTAADPDPLYWLLWILRDLRGQRVPSTSTEEGVLTCATLEEDRVTVIAFNDSPTARSVTLKVNMVPGWWTGPEVRAIGESAQGTLERVSLPLECARDGGKAEGTLQLPAHGTASVSFRVNGFPTPSRQIVRQESFGDRTLQSLQAEPVSVKIAGPAAAPPKAWLRVGLLGSQPGDKLSATLNGVPLLLQPTALQDLPVDARTLKGDNELRVNAAPADNPRLALGFAALVFEEAK